jgi:translation elongation factor EF-Ts
MGSYIEALKENSGDIVQALELLQGKNLSAFDKKELKSIQKHLKEIDKNLKDIGE